MSPDEVKDIIVDWLPMVILVASAINAFTNHHSKHGSWTGAFLALCERLSILTSRNATSKIGRLKMPGTDVKPK